jgi:hypothetical protein
LTSHGAKPGEVPLNFDFRGAIDNDFDRTLAPVSVASRGNVCTPFEGLRGSGQRCQNRKT